MAGDANGGQVLVRGIVRVSLALVLAGWWLTPTTLHAVATEPVSEPAAAAPVCASWSFGEATSTGPTADIAVTVVVTSCPAGD